MTDLAAIRRAYARKIMGLAGVTSPALEEAFATVRREDFVGPGPWNIFKWTGYGATPDSDPAHLYDDVLVALVPERRINNGQPSGHAMWLAAADPRPGDHAVHIGAGTGYYSAILAELVDPAGRVTAIEYDPNLAVRATANLADRENVAVIRGDGCALPFDPADVIYVNAGVTRPAESWLDGLREGGRLVLPLTANSTEGRIPPGAVFRFERRGTEFLVRVVSPTAFIPCEGLREAESGEALAEAFAKGGAERVTRLVRGGDPPDEQCWLRGPGWSLLY